MKPVKLKKMFNIIFSSGLSLLIINSVLSLNPSHNDSHRQYGFCNTGCQDDKHFSNTLQCDQIQINSQKYTFIKEIINFIDLESEFFELQNKSYIQSLRSFSLYCRPPPNFFS